jgi:hypothetical protein
VKFGARTLVVPLCWLSLAGCGTDSPPAAPTLQLPFTSSASAPVLFNNVQGVLVGTTGNFAFGVLNGGTQDLVIQSVSYAGNVVMALQPFAQPVPASLAFNEEFVIALQCTPPAVEDYPGTVTILSNDANSPSVAVYLSCQGMGN